GQFVFGSEIKALFAHPGVSREIDLVGLDHVFTFWSTLPPRTVWKNVFELPPGHVLRLRGGEIQTRPYWQLDYPTPDPALAEHEYAERLIDLLAAATRLRLRADVPVGAYLSGGIDSSLITAIIHRHTDTKLRTFSVAFEDAEFDERPHQREVVHY